MLVMHLQLVVQMMLLIEMVVLIMSSMSMRMMDLLRIGSR